MTEILFGPGARGTLIEELQAGLTRNGFAPGRIDGDFGRKTQDAVRAYQAASGSDVTGCVTRPEWTAITGKDVPPLADRCLQLTAAFEGHDYTVAKGNWDGAWLTWGIIGFTLRHGGVQQIIRAVDTQAPERVSEAFGAEAETLLRVIMEAPAQQEGWAARISRGSALVEPWNAAFARFGSFPEVQQAQRDCACEGYFKPALRSAAALGLTTEVGIALLFDVHVQNGGVPRSVRAALPPYVPGEPEGPRRELIANGVADHARPEFRENVRRRKLAIARGAGTANGVSVVLERWGLAAIPAVVA